MIGPSNRMNDDSLYEKNCDEEGISRIREKVDNIEKYLIKLTKNIEENFVRFCGLTHCGTPCRLHLKTETDSSGFVRSSDCYATQNAKTLLPGLNMVSPSNLSLNKQNNKNTRDI